MASAPARAWKSFLQIIALGLLVVLFLITVMTAVAQQEALARMAKEELQLGYSSAYALVRSLDEREKELPSLRTDERSLMRQLVVAQSAFRRSKDRMDSAWQALVPVAQRAARAGQCEISSGPTDDLGLRLQRWSELKECLAAGTLPRSLAPMVEQVVAGSGNLEEELKSMRDAYDKLTTVNEQLAVLRPRIEAASTLTEAEQKAKASFAEMNVLRQYWMLGGGFLVSFPPPMLQILLAFVSGAFGALLVTLVLIVYPNAKLEMEAGQETWARILLGGLIAMCVYIVLLGGTAVLGSSVEMTAAGTNYMAFCAIGILAGMFSDRVAYWLSDKADAFFKRNSPKTD